MKRFISNENISKILPKKKSEIKEIKIKYIILNKKNVYKSAVNFLYLTSSNIKFDIDIDNFNIFQNNTKIIKTKDIQLFSYSEENSLFCLTINDRCYNNMFSSAHGFDIIQNSIWFCIDIKDIETYKNTYQSIIQLYFGVFPIKPLTEDSYKKFKKIMYTKPHKNDEEFVTDWSYYITQSSSSSSGKPVKNKLSSVKYIYNPCNSQSVEITVDDLQCLKLNKKINDNIINFYLSYIHNEILDYNQRERSHFFNLFFNTKLIGSDVEQLNDTALTRHSRVAKWTKNVDIFSKDFIIIPVIEDDHWFLVVVCFPWMVGMVDYETNITPGKQATCSSSISENKTPFATQFRVERLSELKSVSTVNPMPCILIFDSFTTKVRRSKIGIVREYLQSEWDSKRVANDGPLTFDKTTCRGYSPKVPQQKNLFDCGIYLLHYVEMFFKEPVEDFSLIYFKSRLLNWFDNHEVNKKRKFLRELIKQKLKSVVKFEDLKETAPTL